MSTRTILMIVIFPLIFLGSTAVFAQEGWSAEEGAPTENRFGVGVETGVLSPFSPAVDLIVLPSGSLSFSFDAKDFRIDGLFYLMFMEDTATLFSLGGRFFYVIDRGKSSDFALGGGVSLGFFDPEVGDDGLRVAIEGAAQLRAFVTPNVACFATLGLGASFGDGDSVFGIRGQLSGVMGLMYYF